MKPNKSFDLLSSLSFCVVDIEATGGNYLKDQIIEIGLVHIDQLKITKEKHFLIKPTIEIPKFIQKLTSLSSAKLENAPAFKDIIPELLEFIGDRIIVAHNTSFDIPFLNLHLKQHGIGKLKNKNLCTQVMTKYLIPEIVNSNLTYLCDLFSVDLVAHRALDDAKATAQILLRYLELFMSKGITKVNHLYYPRNKFELDRNYYDVNNKALLLETISKQTSSMYVVLTSENGLIEAVLPIKSGSEMSHAQNFIHDLTWSRATLYLTGNFFESLRRTNLHFFKMPPEAKSHTLNYLKTIIEKIDNQSLQKLNSSYQAFMIFPHLIENQYNLYFINNATFKNKLIFKIPGHEKKLSQFSKKVSEKKNSSTDFLIHSDLKIYIYSYLVQATNNQAECLVKSPPEFKIFLENLDSSNSINILHQLKNNYNYPRVHI